VNVTDSQQQAGGSPGDRDSSGWVILGVVLIVAGFFLGARNFGLVPWVFDEAWGVVIKARYGIGVVLLGVLLIVWAQSGHRFTAPRSGAKLHRSREDKWLAGVLAGLGDYLSVDPTLLRLAFIALVVLFDMGALVAAYIIMAIIVPQAPVGVAPVSSTSIVAPAPAPAAPAPAPESTIVDGPGSPE
jgi:phage shock protein PspC (stress-responsive transcriptional regulator)